ncbi:hypothetical protein ES707_10783 [subsurface metagenome]
MPIHVLGDTLQVAARTGASSRWTSICTSWTRLPALARTGSGGRAPILKLNRRTWPVLQLIVAKLPSP